MLTKLIIKLFTFLVQFIRPNISGLYKFEPGDLIMIFLYRRRKKFSEISRMISCESKVPILTHISKILSKIIVVFRIYRNSSGPCIIPITTIVIIINCLKPVIQKMVLDIPDEFSFDPASYLVDEFIDIILAE